MNICVFELINGSVVVGDVFTKVDSNLVVKKPRMLVPSERGSVQIVPVSALFFSDEDVIEFPSTSILTLPLKVKKEIESNYIQATTSIQLATQ